LQNRVNLRGKNVIVFYRGPKSSIVKRRGLKLYLSLKYEAKRKMRNHVLWNKRQNTFFQAILRKSNASNTLFDIHFFIDFN